MRAPRLLLFLILVGLLVRVVCLGQVAALPFFHEPVGDSARYLDRAQEILGGDFKGDRPFFYGGIFYPWLLAADLLVFGRNLYPVCLLQALAGCGLALILFRFARLATAAQGEPASLRVGLTAAGMVVLYGPFAFLEADLLMVSWTLLAAMGCALLLMESTRARGPVTASMLAAAAGLCLGIAISDRPNLLPMLPAVAGWAVLFSPPRRKLAAGCAAAAGGACVVLLVALLNHAASGRWVLLTTSGGINFAIGNHEGARGTYDEPWSEKDPEFTASHVDLEEASLVMARRESRRDLDAVDASSYWFGRGRAFLQAEPAAATRLYLRKLLLFWNGEEIPNHLDFAFIRQSAPALWLMPLSFAVIAPLGIYGLFHPGARSLMNRPALALVGLGIVMPMLTVLPFFVVERYRIVIVPPLMVSAACGLQALRRLIEGRLTRRRACLHIACLALLALAMSQPMRQSDPSRNHLMMAQAYRGQGRLPEAIGFYRSAVAANHANAVAHNGLGVALEQAGDLDGAREAYRQAALLAPSLALPHRNLGLILMRGLPSTAGEARRHLLQAEAAAPDDVDVARALAALMLAQGEAAEARARARKVLSRLPEDRTALHVMEATAGADASFVP